MSNCNHDKRFSGVFDLPKEDAGCVACAFERASTENDRLKTEVLKIIDLLRAVGEATKWQDRDQTDRVFAWYEFDDLRAALGEGEGWGNNDGTN